MNSLFQRRWPGAALVLAALLVAGCAVLGPSPTGGAAPSRDALDDFALEGRFSLRHENQSYSGRLSWRHAGAKDEVLLASPFGQGIAQISADDRGAQLTTGDGKSYTASDSETLTREVLGYPLPLARLSDWLRARGGAGRSELDGQGRLLRLRDAGWRIDYEYDGEHAQALPSRLFAQRDDGIELRLRIDEWTSLPPAQAAP